MRRLLRACSALALTALMVGPAMSLETPLIAVNGKYAALVNSGSGMVNIYELNDKQTVRHGGFNFLTDLSYYDSVVMGERGGSVYTKLRTGTETMDPPVEKLIEVMFKKEPTKEQKEKGRPSDRETVREAEDAFWSKDQAYDGTVRIAYGARLIMIAVPSKHAVLFYEISDIDRPIFSAAYNFGPALYVALGYNTTPNPIDIANKLALPEAERKQLEEGFKKTEDGGPAQAAKCELWGVASNNFYALVDSANNKIILFEDTGKKIALRSVRSIAADLQIPLGFQALPDESEAVRALLKEKPVDATLKELGVQPFDQFTLRAFVNHIQVGEEGKKTESLQANSNNSQIILDFTGQRKLLVYNLQGQGNSLELASARDYTFEVASNSLARFVNNRIKYGPEAWNNAKETLKASPKIALRNLKIALTLNPKLVEVAAKDAGFKKLKDDFMTEYEALIETGQKANDELKATVKTILEEAEEARKKDKDKANKK